MPLLVTAKQPTSKLDAGTYTAVCTGIIEDTMPESKFTNDIYRFYFDVDDLLDEEGNQATTDAISSRTLSPKSKLWGWLIAFGLRPEVGKVIDIEEVVGKHVMLVVTPSDSGEYNRVSNIVPLPKGKANGAAPGGDVLTEASALANWMDEIRAIGYTTKEIIDFCQSKFGRKPNELSASEREDIGKELAA